VNAAILREALLRGRRRPRSLGSGSPTVFRGDGLEFVELREYEPGDDPRRIDWAATARSGALQTRVVFGDVALTLAAIVDESPSMHVGRHVTPLTGAYDALEAWYAIAQTDDRCVRITARTVVTPTDRGRRAARICQSVRTTTFELEPALRMARAALPPGTALLLVTDAYDVQPVVRGDDLLSMLGRRYDCTVLLARDPWYEGLPLRGFVTLRDAESGATRRFYLGGRQRARYLAATRARETALRETFERANWRTGTLIADGGAASLYRAFGVVPQMRTG
jgi:uncharacterized protein (DUF58 family)